MTQSQKLTTDSYDQQLRFREDLVNQAYDKFISYATRLTKNKDWAQDLVQQCLFYFFKNNKERETQTTTNAQKYLYRTIYFKFIEQKKARSTSNIIPFEPKHENILYQKDSNRWPQEDHSPSCQTVFGLHRLARRAKATGIHPAKSIPMDHTNSAPNRTTTRKQKIGAIMAAMETLPQKKRKIIQLHYLEGYSHKEIQKMLNMKRTAECQACRIAKLKMKEKVFLNSHLSS